MPGEREGAGCFDGCLCEPPQCPAGMLSGWQQKKELPDTQAREARVVPWVKLFCWFAALAVVSGVVYTEVHLPCVRHSYRLMTERLLQSHQLPLELFTFSSLLPVDIPEAPPSEVRWTLDAVHSDEFCGSAP